jgi:hypothetical protein
MTVAPPKRPCWLALSPSGPDMLLRQRLLQRAEPRAADLASDGEMTMTDESHAQEWRPIETAPKDSHSRLVWCPER